MTTDFRLSRRSDVPRLRELWQEAFGDPETYLDLFFSAAWAPERCMVLESGGNLTGAAYWLRCELEGRPLAYVYAVAIDEKARGLGLGKALMGQLAKHLKSNYDAILLVPGDESLRRFYRKLGYCNVSFHTRLTADPGTPAKLTTLPPAEYAALRREYLPEKGVIQEGENLRLLSGMAKFYRGEEFLAAVTEEGCLEFLGDIARIPSLAAALGRTPLPCRIPGSDIPYAMALPLKGPGAETIYFGFGFD